MSKSPAMEAFLETIAGRTTAHAAQRCIPPDLGCGRQITASELAAWPPVNVDEYRISGWCKECQDRIFGDEG